jgi:hypothetical protein
MGVSDRPGSSRASFVLVLHLSPPSFVLSGVFLPRLLH